MMNTLAAVSLLGSVQIASFIPWPGTEPLPRVVDLDALVPAHGVCQLAVGETFVGPPRPEPIQAKDNCPVDAEFRLIVRPRQPRQVEGFLGERGQFAERIKPEFAFVEANEPLAQRLLSYKWPLRRIQLSSRFGKRGAEFHEGVDLLATTGTPVFAAQAGRVAYAGEGKSGYGKLVILEHAGSITTHYAHNSRILVKRGQRVVRGQTIATSGNTGKSTGPHLHFEIREGLVAMNPMKVMPAVA